MGLFNNEKSNWLGIIVNPIGYIQDHKPIGEAAQKYYDAYPPHIDLTKATELSYKTYRQQWIDDCTSDVKSGDVGYSKANAAGACAACFDADPLSTQVTDALNDQAAAEKAQVQAKTAKNTKIILILIAAFLFIGLLVYLFIS